MNDNKDKEYSYDLGCCVCRASAFDQKRNAIWLVTTDSAYVLKLDLEMLKISEGFSIPLIDNPTEYDYIYAFIDEDDLHVVSYDGRILVSIDLVTSEINVFDLDLNKQAIFKEKSLSGAVNRDGCYYFIGQYLKAIIKYQPLNSNIKNIVIDDLGDINGLFAYSFVAKDDYLYIPRADRYGLVEFDLKNNTGKEITLFSELEGGFNSILLDGDWIYLASTEGDVVKYNKKTENIEKYKMCEESLFGIFKQNDKVFCFSLNTPCIWLLKEGGDTKKIEVPYRDDAMIGEVYSKFEFMCEVNDTVYFQSRTNGEVMCLDKNNDCVKKVNVMVDSTLRERIVSSKLNRSGVIKESIRINMRDFIMSI